MKTIAGTLAVALAAATVAGCASSPLKDRFESTNKEIRAARAAGATKYAPVDYMGAEQALELAQDSESDALSAREDAEEARDEGKLELAQLAKQVAEREEALDEAEKRRIGADGQLAALRRRESELRMKGVSDKEIDRAIGEQIALTQLEASAARASQKTIRAEIDLLKARQMQTQARIVAANDGIAAAGQQLLHASALCDTAGAAARMAEAHAIARRKAELEVR